MDYVPITGYDEGINVEDRPRFLTREEITFITSHMPLAPSADNDAAQLNRDNIIRWITAQLRDLKLCPSAIPDYITTMTGQHYKSLIAPGTPVGIGAAEALGATNTQMTLNTFHTSGSSKSVSAGNDALTDVIFARKNPKNESCTIYFTNKQLTYEEVLNTRSYIVGSMVSDFVVDYDIDDIATLPRYWWHNTVPQLLGKQIHPATTKALRLFLNLPEMYKHRVTVSQIATVLEHEVPSSVIAVHGPLADGIIDLYPQPELILKTLQDAKIVNVPAHLLETTFLQTIVMPELDRIRVKGIAGIHRLYPIVSPVWRVVIVERKVEERDLVDPAVNALLSPHLGQAYVLMLNQGMMNLTGISSRNVAALCELAGVSVISAHAVRAGQDNHDRLYVAVQGNDRYTTEDAAVVIRVDNKNYKRLDPTIVIRANGGVYRVVSTDNIRQDAQGWIEAISDKIEERVPDNDVVQENTIIRRRVTDFIEREGLLYERITNPAVKVTELKPGEYITVKIAEAKLRRSEEIRIKTEQTTAAAQLLPEAARRAALRRPVNVPKSPLVNAAEFVFAETDGANLKELLALPGIDKRRTTCNNMYIIAETFGIEAARSFIIRALHNVIANAGSYIHPANITFIAEFITSRGKPYGATYTGISRQPGGHLSLATLERAGKVFIQNAIHGRKEDIRGVSASVAVGARMAIGTGYSDIGQDIIENGQARIVINDDVFRAHERDDEEKIAMEQITIPAGDLTDAVNLLKTMQAGGGGFDTNADEEGTNLLTAFAGGEIIPDLNQRQLRTDIGPQRVVRRVQDVAGPRSPTVTDAALRVPEDLVDILTLIKTGIPTDEQGAISPLEELPAEPDVAVQPIQSTGLVTLDDAPPPTMGMFTTDFMAMLGGLPTIEAPMEPEPFSPPAPIAPTVVQGLPEFDIPELPPLDDFDLQRDLYEARREQVRDLEIIDTGAFMAATQGQQ